eukprot:TRINITY_DN3654_c0_g1_i1.p1 TRINITY_DN3654_c0_g1~~TRINITY_DN3654_c0_g1_i1.p1  ORF type:complete len:163 (+),score=16.29 TRINITY_DN3654_c0_g1_i1:294-782(+)
MADAKGDERASHLHCQVILLNADAGETSCSSSLPKPQAVQSLSSPKPRLTDAEKTPKHELPSVRCGAAEPPAKCAKCLELVLPPPSDQPLPPPQPSDQLPNFKRFHKIPINSPGQGREIPRISPEQPQAPHRGFALWTDQRDHQRAAGSMTESLYPSPWASS